MLPRLKREVIDVEVEVSFKQAKKRSSDQEGDSFEVYHPKGETSKATENFRLIGVFDEKSKTYHLYITNITPEQTLGGRCGAPLPRATRSNAPASLKRWDKSGYASKGTLEH